MYRFLDRTHRSLSDLYDVGLTDDTQTPHTDTQGNQGNQEDNIVRFESLLDKRRQQIKDEKQDLMKLEDREIDSEADVEDWVPEEHRRPFRY